MVTAITEYMQVMTNALPVFRNSPSVKCKVQTGWPDYSVGGRGVGAVAACYYLAHSISMFHKHMQWHDT